MTRLQIIQAVKELASICSKHKDCKNCPFYDKTHQEYSMCIFKMEGDDGEIIPEVIRVNYEEPEAATGILNKAIFSPEELAMHLPKRNRTMIVNALKRRCGLNCSNETFTKFTLGVASDDIKCKGLGNGSVHSLKLALGIE